MLKLEKDLKCILHDPTKNKDLFEFTAQQASDATFTAGFINGVASDSQTLTIITEKKYDYHALEHIVIIDGKQWLLTSWTPSIRRKLGAGITKKPKKVYVLNLE